MGPLREPGDRAGLTSWRLRMATNGGGGVDEQVASKVVVRCVAQVEQSPHHATVAEAFRAPLDALQVTRLAL